MIPVSPTVPGLNLEQITIAEHQPEYLPLPAIIVGDRVVTRWKLSWAERFRILFSGNLWLILLTFGQPVQPIMLYAESPKQYIQNTGSGIEDYC
jgi:hypothetical protein